MGEVNCHEVRQELGCSGVVNRFQGVFSTGALIPPKPQRLTGQEFNTASVCRNHCRCCKERCSSRQFRDLSNCRNRSDANSPDLPHRNSPCHAHSHSLRLTVNHTAVHFRPHSPYLLRIVNPHVPIMTLILNHSAMLILPSAIQTTRTSKVSTMTRQESNDRPCGISPLVTNPAAVHIFPQILALPQTRF